MGFDSNIVDKISTRVDTDPEAPVEDVFFAGEVRVDGPGGQSGGFDDVAHGGVGVALFEEAANGGFDDLGSACGFGGVC